MDRLIEATGVGQAVFDALPAPTFIVDANMKIVDRNRAATTLTDADGTLVVRNRDGAMIRCLHVLDHVSCGSDATLCRSCVLRQTVHEALDRREPVRRQAKIELHSTAGGRPRDAYYAVTAAPVEAAGEALVIVSLEDVNELTALQRLLPICAHCKKIRDDKEYWSSIEEYLAERLDLSFSHGVCPECYETLSAEIQRQAENW